MKQMHCPHFVRMSGTQYYCMKGNFPVDCYKCNCSDKKEIEVTITTSPTSDYKNTNTPQKDFAPIPPRNIEPLYEREELNRDGDTVGIRCPNNSELMDKVNEIIERINTMELELTPIQKKLMEISKPRSEKVIKRVEERREKRKERYKQGYKDAVDKACEWLEENGRDYATYDDSKIMPSMRADVNIKRLIKDFRKAMEE